MRLSDGDAAGLTSAEIADRGLRATLAVEVASHALVRMSQAAHHAVGGNRGGALGLGRNKPPLHATALDACRRKSRKGSGSGMEAEARDPPPALVAAARRRHPSGGAPTSTRDHSWPEPGRPNGRREATSESGRASSPRLRPRGAWTWAALLGAALLTLAGGLASSEGRVDAYLQGGTGRWVPGACARGWAHLGPGQEGESPPGPLGDLRAGRKPGVQGDGAVDKAMREPMHTATAEGSAATERALGASLETAEEEQQNREVQELVDLEAAETESALDSALEGYLKGISENSDSELGLLCPSELSSSGPPPLEVEEGAECADRLQAAIDTINELGPRGAELLELLGQAGGGLRVEDAGSDDRADGATDVGVAAEEELAQQELVGQGPLFELLEEAAAEVVSTEGPELAEALAVGAGAQTYLAEGSGGAEEVLQEKAGATELLQQDLPPDEDVTVAVEQQAVSAVPPGGDSARGPQAFYDHGVHEMLTRGYREHGIVGKRAADELARLRGEGDEVSASHALSRTSHKRAARRIQCRAALAARQPIETTEDSATITSLV